MKLETGYNHSFEIRKEIYPGKCRDNFSILYLSDLHLNKFSALMIKKIISVIEDLDPTIILFGGDYADSKKGLLYFDHLLSAISDRKNMFAIAGNHDYYIGINKIEKIISANNILWLENKSYSLNLENTEIRIDGNFKRYANSVRDFSILFLHKPVHPNKYKNIYDIAFAGHLHGCQVVLWRSGNKLFPGRFFYKWNVLKTVVSNCQYFISKGLGDTLPVRFHCKRDMLFVQITGTP